MIAELANVPSAGGQPMMVVETVGHTKPPDPPRTVQVGGSDCFPNNIHHLAGRGRARARLLVFR